MASSDSTHSSPRTEQNGAIRGLPFARGRSFRTLDEYLAHLEVGGGIDLPWYREIRPGVYRLETGNYRGPEVEQRIFTREELERKFGFSSR